VAELYLKGIDADELRKHIVSDVLAALRPMLTQANEPPRLVNRERMAKLAGVSLPTLDRLVAEKVVPSKLVGTRRLFEPAKVIDALPNANPDG